MAGQRYGESNGAGQPPEAGLCARCRHAARQRSARGSEFWRCRAAERDPTLPRYPPLPVQRCRAFAPGRS